MSAGWPYPGLAYGLPLGIALLVLALVALVGVVLALTWDAPPLSASRDRGTPAASGSRRQVTSE